MRKKVVVIGGGWYGAHIALELGQQNYDVTVCEKNDRLFSEISGLFGIRLHIGPHYPRSASTRKSCLYGFHAFTAKYPELIVAHDSSVYAIGKADAKGFPSKISVDAFIKVCKENSKCRVIYDIEGEGYDNLLVAVELAEPSVYVGRGLHDYFQGRLLKAGVNVSYNCNIKSVKKLETGEIEIQDDNGGREQFDYAINTTSFQSILPSSRLKLPFEVFYQPCLALVYEDTQPRSEKPFSFIVMDGWYPCMMPSVEYGKEAGEGPTRYILTHGMWTIMASYSEISNAKIHLASINDEFIESNIRPNCEKEITRFLPYFKQRFKYVKWVGAVLAKIRNNSEFRSSITFQDDESGMIHVVPGKVSNIFDSKDEVDALLQNRNIIQNKGMGYSYVRGGTLEYALPEFKENVTGRNTCDLQTFKMPGVEGERTLRLTSKKKETLFSTGSINRLILPMMFVFAINEYRQDHSKAARLFLGLTMLVASIVKVNEVFDFSFFKKKSSNTVNVGSVIQVQDQAASRKTYK